MPEIRPETLLPEVQTRMRALEESVCRVVRGIDRAVHLTTIALFARGHVLYHGLPGQGKTLLSLCFARAIGGVSERFQGSPDFLFSEALISAFPDHSGELRYYPGRLLRHGERLGIVLIDEINRFLPNTQAGFLEVMQERKVTTANRTYDLPHFIGIATQNPLEAAETYPLPEALLDRFLMTVRVDYPDPEAEVRILLDPSYRRMEEVVASIEPVCTLEELDAFARMIRTSVHVSPARARSVQRLGDAARAPSRFGISLKVHEYLYREIVAGASTRALAHVITAAQVAATYEGRTYVTPEDVHEVAHPVLEHRIFVRPVARTQHPDLVHRLVEEILRRVPAP